MEKDRQDVVRDHEFDGIQEYDNRLPNWWLGTFVVTVLFGFYYWGSRHMFQTAPNQKEAFEIAMNELAGGPGGDGAAEALPPVEELMKDQANIDAGAELFKTHCAACHLVDGGGLVGPNLTDNYWIHGNKPEDIVRTITNGVPEKGMVPWKSTLTALQIRQVAGHVLRLHGTTPAKAKEPQGDLME